MKKSAARTTENLRFDINTVAAQETQIGVKMELLIAKIVYDLTINLIVLMLVDMLTR